MSKVKIATLVPALLFLGACAGSMTLIPRSGGEPLQANYQDSMGESTIDFVLPNGEEMKGNLTWIPPGGGLSTTIVNTGNDSLMASGMTTGNKGMFVGSAVGDKGTTMRIELLCNAWTGKCVGAGKTSEGIIYDIQR